MSDLPGGKEWLRYLYMHRDARGIYVETPEGRRYIHRLAAAQILKANADALAGQFIADNDYDDA